MNFYNVDSSMSVLSMFNIIKMTFSETSHQADIFLHYFEIK